VIEVLYFSDRDVRRKLFERVGAATRLLLVTGTRHGAAMSAVAGREPFVSLDEAFGDVLDQLVVADEGAIEGMWRDPLGDLADALFPDDRKAAYAAATGYLLLHGGAVKATVKKQGAPDDDRWFIQAAVAKLEHGVPPPDPARKPGPGRKKRSAERPADTQADRPTPPRPRPAAKQPAADAWAVLGIARGTPLAEAKKAFRALISQYHPDKVAHLAPEFRELADRRTRLILEAWEQVEAEARR
jgi:hypothetical protein